MQLRISIFILIMLHLSISFMLRRACVRCYTKSSLQMMPEGPEVASLVEVMNTKYGILSYLFRKLLAYLFTLILR